MWATRGARSGPLGGWRVVHKDVIAIGVLTGTGRISWLPERGGGGSGFG